MTKGAVVTVFLFLLAGCTSAPRYGPVPPDIQDKAWRIVAGRLGERRAGEWVHPRPTSRWVAPQPECERCTPLARGGYYQITFDLCVPGVQFAHGDCGLIEFQLDSTGAVAGRQLYGLPDCVSDPSRCEFNVTTEEAVTIARDAGLTGDPETWETRLGWNAKEQRWRWSVANEYRWYEEPIEHYRCDVVSIDPRTGHVLDMGQSWAIP